MTDPDTRTDGPASPAERVSKPEPTLHRRLPAGVMDAMLASLAAFGVGLVAVTVFDASELGVYAVFFAGFMLATIVAYQLVYVPAEITAAKLPVGERLGVITRSLRFGIVPSLVGSLAILLAALAMSTVASTGLLVGLSVTAWLAAMVSPAQDHLRRLLHFGGWSWDAVAVSAVQLGTVIVSVGVMVLLRVHPAWIPFGGLAIANIVSLAFALFLAAVHRNIVPLQRTLYFRELIHTGRWLLLQGALPIGAAFTAAWMIAAIAGPEALGHADAARVAAQPVLVLGMGLSAVLGPRAMEAAVTHRRSRANAVVLAHIGLVTLGGALYLLIAAGPLQWNPMHVLIPKAYVVPGLVAATVVVNIVIASLFIVTSELAAAGRVRLLAAVSAAGGLFQILVTTSAGSTGAFARPLGLGASNVVRVVGYSVGRNRFYDDPGSRASAPDEAGSLLCSESGSTGGGTGVDTGR